MGKEIKLVATLYTPVFSFLFNDYKFLTIFANLRSGARYHFMRQIVIYDQDWPCDYGPYSLSLPLGCRTKSFVILIPI